MSTSAGSIIVISHSDKFPTYLDGLMITNTHFVSLDSFIMNYLNFPLTASKIIVFESAIVNVDSIRKFSDIILNELSQVDEILFLVGVDFKQYFLVSLAAFHNKKFLPEDITYKNLENVVTETRSYTLKSEAELVEVVQRKRKVKETDKRIGRFQTRVTIDRKIENSKIEKEVDLLNKDVIVEGRDVSTIDLSNREFDYINYKRQTSPKSNNIILYDNGFNIYNALKSEHAKGRKLLFIDYTDSMFFSFLVENDKEIPSSLRLESIYSEGAHNPQVRNYIENNDIVIIRNSYNLKKTLSKEEMESLIKFVLGKYSRRFESVFIITDDIKVSWAGLTRYVILPPSIDYLLKFVNYVDRDSVTNTYLRLGGKSEIKGFNIDESAIRSYLANLNVERVRVIDGGLRNGETQVDKSLFEIPRLEAEDSVKTEEVGGK